MTEDYATYMTAPTSNGDRPLPRRVGTRTLLPTTWVNRTLKVEYVTADGKGATSEGTLLDWCGAGPILLLAGSRCVLAWDRICLIELAGD